MERKFFLLSTVYSFFLFLLCSVDNHLTKELKTEGNYIFPEDLIEFCVYSAQFSRVLIFVEMESFMNNIFFHLFSIFQDIYFKTSIDLILFYLCSGFSQEKSLIFDNLTFKPKHFVTLPDLLYSTQR